MPKKNIVRGGQQTSLGNAQRTARGESFQKRWSLLGDDRADLDFLADVFLLNSVKGFGPVKFRDLFNSGISPQVAIHSPSRMKLAGKVAAKIRNQLIHYPRDTYHEIRLRAERQLELAEKHGVSMVSYGNREYPEQIFLSNNPVPILFVRGNTSVLSNKRTVACVGSRKIRSPYSELHSEFVRIASREGFAIVSGFALGADTIGHEEALDHGGKTICVMPNGLDRPFPPENRELWERVISHPRGVVISEYPLGMRASSLTLRKRNKLIVACSLGVLISQSGKKGGSLNAFRFAIEQRKPIATFIVPSDIGKDSLGNSMICDSVKGNVTAFYDDDDREEGYNRWLQRLLSLT